MTRPEIDVCNKISSQAMSDPYVKRCVFDRNAEKNDRWKTQYDPWSSHFIDC